MTGFWIFLVIAVLQVVIGAIAKSAEARKKREAARLKLEAARSTPPRSAPAGGPSQPTEARSAAVSTAAPPPSGPRQLGLVIREAMGTAGSATGRTTSAEGKTRAELLAERQRRVEALRRRQAQAAGRSEPPPPSRKPPAPPVVRAEPVVAPPAAAPRPTTPTTPPSSPAIPVRQGSTSLRATSAASGRIRRLLRQPASVRDAILLAEILREPVALRQQPPGPTA